jgi:prevent-host-death family protein
MKQVDIAEAKAKLSELLDAAARGQSTVIARAGRPVAKIVPLGDKPKSIKFGTYRGRMRIGEGFDAQDEEIAELFENGTIFPPKPKK